MENLTINNSSKLKIAVFVVMGMLIWGAVDKNKSDKSALLDLAKSLETASENRDKSSPTLLFDQLDELKYKYAEEKNMPCLQAVMALTGSADEVNETGHWTGKEETLTAINQCKG